MHNTSSSLKPFKRATSLELSKWYMGILLTNLTETPDTNGAFSLFEAFLPRFKPHAFIIRSPRLRLLILFTPAGVEEAFRSMSSPAQNLNPPKGVLTYSAADLEQTVQRFSTSGVRMLAP